MISSRAMLAPLLLGAALAAHAAPLKIDPARSSVSATFRQMNVPVEAKFNKFSVQIDYDARKPDYSKAKLEIDTASLDLGDPDMNREVAKPEWFNAAKFPKASFVSTTIRTPSPGKLSVAGKLIIKGRSLDVSFPMTMTGSAGKLVFEGQLPIRRSVFSVGEGEWKDTSMVADEVLIKFRVTAAQ